MYIYIYTLTLTHTHRMEHSNTWVLLCDHAMTWSRWNYGGNSSSWKLISVRKLDVWTCSEAEAKGIYIVVVAKSGTERVLSNCSSQFQTCCPSTFHPSSLPELRRIKDDDSWWIVPVRLRAMVEGDAAMPMIGRHREARFILWIHKMNGCSKRPLWILDFAFNFQHLSTTVGSVWHLPVGWNMLKHLLGMDKPEIQLSQLVRIGTPPRLQSSERSMPQPRRPLHDVFPWPMAVQPLCIEFSAAVPDQFAACRKGPFSQ